MPSHRPARPPAYPLFAAMLWALAWAAAAISVSARQPWLGLTLHPAQDGAVEVVLARGPASGIPAGARLMSVARPGDPQPVELRADDLMEEPDLLATYEQFDGFLARQGRIADVLAAHEVRLAWQAHPGGAIEHSVVRPRPRPAITLPQLFWFQVFVSVTGCLIASWVWALRPSNPGAAMFGLTGLLFPAFAMPAAVYSGRELALDGDLFFWLSAANHASSAMWGAALVAIFLAHPRPLVRPARLAWPFVVAGAWWVADVTRFAPDLDWGFRYLALAEMVVAIGLAGVQWVRSRREPLERAALRWLTLSLFTGSGLFIVTFVATASLGWLPPLPQGYAFGFFLFIYVGIALGLRRYRLFALDAWAFRMLLWIGTAAALLGVDAMLVVWLDWSGGPALGMSIWLVGALYVPARHWLLTWLAHRPLPSLQALIPEVIAIAFEPSAPERARQWDALLQRLYDPLELTADPSERGAEAGAAAADAGAAVDDHVPLRGEDDAAPQAELREDGLAMRVPACAGIAPRRLRYPHRGRRLFVPADRELVDALCALMTQAELAREARERGAQEERRRIARDMHDDVGARLLMLIHRAATPDQAELARAAMTDLRTALAVLDASPVPLAEALADWRAEAAARCEAAGVALEWIATPGLPDHTLSSRQKALLERTLREGLTNALKHARPARVRIAIDAGDDAIELRVRNDGLGAPPARWVEGRGLLGMRQRLAELGGQLAIGLATDDEVEVTARLPLANEDIR